MNQATPTPSSSASPDANGWRFERAAVIGAGAMGTLLASLLSKRVPAVLVCRNANRASSLFQHGATITGAIEHVTHPIIVPRIADILSVGGASAIFVATKTTAIPAVARDLAPVLAHLRSCGERPLAISFQNGIETGRELIDHLGHPDVLRMVLSLAATMDLDSGEVRVPLNRPPHWIGCIDQRNAPPCRAIATTLTDCGLETQFSEHIEVEVWKKGIVNAAMNPVAALVNSPVGDVLDSPARHIFDELLEEGIAVARGSGVALPASFGVNARAMADAARAHVPSMVEDIRSARESEVGQLNRQIVEYGKRHGVPTPTHKTIDALIETFDWKVYRRSHQKSRGAPAP